MEREHLLQAISEVRVELDRLNKKLILLVKRANEGQFLQQVTDIKVDAEMLTTILEIEFSDLISESKKQELADARSLIAWHLVHTMLHTKYAVSKVLKKDHSTVDHMCRRYTRFMHVDEAFRNKNQKILDSYYMQSLYLQN